MNATAEITMPLEQWTETVIDRALAKHAETCPVADRVRVLEIRVAALIGYMVGSGVVGGAAGAVIAKLMGA
ncbi:MAG TPA: hypothetical protein PKG77_24850 [Phycisphaerae bacterium]|nr:hypothetical protein [Phycisphaerae bacterium]HQL76236.1 hypothetical protein [Phycisphaerae bacterium]